MIAIVVVVALGGALVGGYQLQRGQIASRALAEGRAAFYHGDWPKAARHLRRYLGKHPDDSTVLRDYGTACLRIQPRAREHVLAAISSFRALLRVERQDHAAFETLAKLYARMGDTANLSHTVDRWAAVAPGKLEPQLWLARSEMMLRDFDAAQMRLRELVDEYPDCVEAYLLLAALQTRPEADEASVRSAHCWLDEAIRRGRGAGQAHLLRAQLLARHGALRDLEVQRRVRADLLAAACDPSLRPETWLEMAALWLKLGDSARTSAALVEAERAWMEHEPDDLEDAEDWISSLALHRIAADMQAGDHSAGGEAAAAALAQLTQPAYRARVLPDAIRLDAALRNCERGRARLAELRSFQPMPRGISADLLSLLDARLAAAEERPYAAIGELETLVSRDGTLLDAWMLLAKLYEQTEQPRRAVAVLRDCARLAPHEPGPALELLRLQVHMQDWQGALATATLAEPFEARESEIGRLRLEAQVGAVERGLPSRDALDRLLADAFMYQHQNPRRVDSYITISKLHALAGRCDLAEDELNRAIAAVDDSLTAELELVRMCVQSGRLESAEVAALRTVAGHPGSAAAAIVLCKVQCADGRFEEGAATLRDAAARLTDVRGRRDLLLERVALAELNDPASRLSLLHEQQASDAGDVRCRVLLLAEPGLSGDGAQQLVDEIRQIEGDAGLTWPVEQARLWLASDAWRERQRQIDVELRRCIEADPVGVQAVLTLGEMYQRSGHWSKCESLYRKALGLNDGAAEVLKQLVRVLGRQGRLSEAGTLLDQYARGASGFDDERLWIAMGCGEFDRAIVLLRRRLEDDPGDSDSRALLATCMFQQSGDGDAALAILDAATSPDSAMLRRASARIAILRSSRRDAEARVFLDELVAGRRDYASHALRAEYRLAGGDLMAAEADWRCGVELSSDGAGHVALARFLMMTRRAADAVSVVEAGLQNHPEHDPLQRLQVRAWLERNGIGDRERVVGRLAELERSCPDDPELTWIRARLEIAEGSPDSVARGERRLMHVVTMEPRFLEAHLGLTELALRRHDLEEARRRITQALNMFPGDASVGLLHARVEWARDPAAAMDVLRGVLRRHGRNADARRLFLEAASQSGSPERYTEALNAANDWIDAAGDSVELEAARAMVLVRLDRVGDAVAGLERFCSRAAPDSRGTALLALAAIHRDSGEFDRASGCLKRAIADGAAGPALLREQWLLLGEQQRLDELSAALTDYARVTQPDPDLLLLGVSILARSPAQLDRTPPILGQILRLAPNRTDLHHQCARLLVRCGHAAEAEPIYRRILASEPQNAGVLNNLAWLLLNKGSEYARALNLADRAVALEPASATFLDTRGLALERLGRLAQARADYERCVGLTEPRPAAHADARLKLARVCAALKDWEAARAELRQITEIDTRAGVLDERQRLEVQQLARLSGGIE